MFNSYTRVCLDEPDEVEAAATRLIRETGGGTALPVASATVVTSTGAARGRSQQGVLQRRGAVAGGGRSGHIRGSDATTWSAASTSTSIGMAAKSGNPVMGNLIDLADDPEPRPGSTSTTSTRCRQRNRPPTPPQPSVELVTMAPSGDPFFDLTGPLSMATSNRQQQHAGMGGTASATSERQQPQHPLDFLLGGLYDEGDAAHADRSLLQQPFTKDGSVRVNMGVSHAQHRHGGAFPTSGSFSDLFHDLGPPSAATTYTTDFQRPYGPGPSAGWNSFNAEPPQASAVATSTHGSVRSSLTRHHHSQSSDGIGDLLQQQWARRDIDGVGIGGGSEAHGWVGATVLPESAGAGAPYTPPGVLSTNRVGPELFDPFGDRTPSSAPASATLGTRREGAPSSAMATAPAGDDGDEGRGSPSAAAASRDDSFTGGGGGGEGYCTNQRELLLYAIPLFRDKLVFLPVVTWKDTEDTNTVLGKVSAGVSSVQQNFRSLWHSLKDKGEFSAKIYRAGQAILENMNAEERLMKNIPKRANKLVVHHPATMPPDEVQEQLTQLTASFCYKSVGKAAVAGVMLPVAVGLEVIAVPGIGWYTAYQLFKSTSAAAGGSRLNNYLKGDKSEVRVCYAPSTKMDLYILKARLSPDGVLGCEDIEDLCHELLEPSLAHPLTELRNRHLRKTQPTKADYALLPMSAPDVDEQYGNNPKKRD